MTSPDAARLSQIGFICATWAHFESNFAHAIWFMLKLEPEVGMIVTGGLDIRPRANMAVRLARKLNAPKELLDALELARKRIEDGLDRRRNLVVHGIHNFRDNRDHPLRLELHRGANPGVQTVSDAELSNLADEITDAALELNAVVVRHYRAAAASMARKTRSAASDTDSPSGS